jgi:thiosulfate/3-mercaptopyruvate sulfurtransferase
MGRLGIGDEHQVVVYDDEGNHIAARLWYLLHYYGHSAVRLLNGGFPKWTAEGRPLTAAVPAHPPAIFTPRVQPGWRVTAAEVRRGMQDPGARLVDCRGPRDFRGEIGRGQRTGRIPGALNVPISALWEGPHKTWKDPERIRALYEGAGVSPARRVITYCNAGVSASVGLLALRLLGYPDAANYAGSWYDWEHDPDNPIATG